MERARAVGARCAVLVVATALLAAPGSASAAISSVLSGQTISGTAIGCAAQADGVRVCQGTDGGAGGTDTRLKSFDGQPLALYVILPPAPGAGSDGSYPLVVQSHGWGGHAGGPGDGGYFGPTADTWAKDGYAVLQLTARGFGDSCGSLASRAVNPSACLNGYVRLDDERYEVRDVQYAAGLLVDQGIVDPARIGVTGPSYGGGVSMELATLKDRIMNPDGSLNPWQSPAGTPLKIAAAAPVIPWSDLAYSLMPNGRTLDYQLTRPSADLSPIGVEKQSFNAILYALGVAAGYYVPPATNPQADLTSWFSLINAGEPYDSSPSAVSIVNQIARYHSAYYLLNGAYGTAKEPPAPLLVANGFTDDLFPVDEALRYYNLERSLYPFNPIALLDGDLGHMRAQNKPGEMLLLSARIQSFFDHYVKGTGAQPRLEVTAFTETCRKGAPSGGPFTASTWTDLHPGEVDYSATATHTISSLAGSATIAKTLDPVAGGGACATAPAADLRTGVATYRLPAVYGNGYTLLGSPTVIANLTVKGRFAYIASRLWDVNPATHQETLVARGIYRIDAAKPDGVQVFQLHPGAWHFAADHVPKLELLGRDPPYARVSNGVFSISISDLRLRLPVHEDPSDPRIDPFVVLTPVPVVTPMPEPVPVCLAYPVSAMNPDFTDVWRRGLATEGTASERPCAHAAPATRRMEHVIRVYVSVYRVLAHDRCRFLRADGRLSPARDCNRPLEFLARGTSHWTLARHFRFLVPWGYYLMRSDAVDALGHHQWPGGTSVDYKSVTAFPAFVAPSVNHGRPPHHRVKRF